MLKIIQNTVFYYILCNTLIFWFLIIVVFGLLNFHLFSTCAHGWVWACLCLNVCVCVSVWVSMSLCVGVCECVCGRQIRIKTLGGLQCVVEVSRD